MTKFMRIALRKGPIVKIDSGNGIFQDRIKSKKAIQIQQGFRPQSSKAIFLGCSSSYA